MLTVRLVDHAAPDSVKLFIRPAAGLFASGILMQPLGGYLFSAAIPTGAAKPEGPYEYVVTMFRGDSATTYPAAVAGKPVDWNYGRAESWTLNIVHPKTPLVLFSPGTDSDRLAFTRIGDAGRRGLFHVGLSGETGRPVFHMALPVDSTGWSPPDYTASLVIKDRIRARQETIDGADALQLTLRGLGPRQVLHLTLMEDDGTSWTTAVPANSNWREATVALTEFRVGRGVLLPQGFPGQWSYWVGPAEGRGSSGDRPRLSRVERIQLSLRREDGVRVSGETYGVEVESVTIRFGRPDKDVLRPLRIAAAARIQQRPARLSRSAHVQAPA